MRFGRDERNCTLSSTIAVVVVVVFLSLVKVSPIDKFTVVVVVVLVRVDQSRPPSTPYVVVVVLVRVDQRRLPSTPKLISLYSSEDSRICLLVASFTVEAFLSPL